MGVGDSGGRHEEGEMGVVTLETASGTGAPMGRGMAGRSRDRGGNCCGDSTGSSKGGRIRR